jgi:hypothetical protein
MSAVSTAPDASVTRTAPSQPVSGNPRRPQPFSSEELRMEADLPRRPSEPSMNDPADREIHRREGRDPYPEPKRGAKDARLPEDDLKDPGDADDDMPHDRGVMRGDEHVGAREDMIDEIGKDKEAWKKGRTQNAPPRRH